MLQLPSGLIRHKLMMNFRLGAIYFIAKHAMERERTLGNSFRTEFVVASFVCAYFCHFFFASIRYQ